VALNPNKCLSIGALVAAFWGRVTITWGLTILETAMLAALPLLMGRSIDGLLEGEAAPFLSLLGVMGALLIIAIGRRVYDTRAYGAMRVELGDALAQKWDGALISKVNARLDMSRELVDFLEEEAPVVMAASLQVVVAIAVLYSFHGIFAAAAGCATIVVLLIYGLSNRRFFKLNRALNQQVEQQVTVLEGGVTSAVRAHLSNLRRQEVRLSDTEAIVYGLIFAVLMAMLSFNLWFAAVKIGATPGQIFAIVTYSYEFLESAVVLPAALQSLTRIAEITARINGPAPAPPLTPQAANEA
jgi:hypothetical protein